MFKKVLQFTIPIVCVLTAWEIISRSGVINSSLFPPPSKAAIAFWLMIQSGDLLSDIAVSMWRLIVGLAIGVASGIIVGLLTGRIKPFASVLSPIIQMLRPLPPVAIIPLIIVWFGIGNGAKIFSIAFAVFFPVWLNTHIGSQNIPQIYLWSAKLLTRSWLKIFTKVVFPAALPFIVAGVRTAIALAFIMVFVSELTGASSGLGYRISITHLAYRIDQMIAALAVLGILGALADWLFSASIQSLFPWIKLKTV